MKILGEAIVLIFLFTSAPPTTFSQVRSRQYNADIQIHTVRHAMLEQLRNPPAGREPILSLPSLHSMWLNFEVLNCSLS